MSRGIVLFGVNNAIVNYVKLAILAASFIKKNMPGTNVCLMTDAASKTAHEFSNQMPLSNFFTHIVLLPKNLEKFENTRVYKDTRYHKSPARFRNEARASVYALSPFDETLLLDSDYLMCSDILSLVWGSTEELMINRDAVGLLHNALGAKETRLNPFGIKMYWATAIYFRKGQKAKLLFDLVEHIRENWEFYRLSYDFPADMFRNDYAFSIALHILGGFNEVERYAAPLPDGTILTALDVDQFLKIHSPSDISFFANDPTEGWKFYVTRVKGLNVHCMNKLSLMNNFDSIMEVLGE